MEIEIVDGNRKVLYRTFTHTFGDAVEEAIKKGICLKNADLRFSKTLRGRDLSDGDLEGANFNFTDLTNTKLPRNLRANLDYTYKDKNGRTR